MINWLRLHWRRFWRNKGRCRWYPHVRPMDQGTLYLDSWTHDEKLAYCTCVHCGACNALLLDIEMLRKAWLGDR